MQRKDFLNEQVYDWEKTDELLWSQGRRSEISRRRSISSFALGIGATVAYMAPFSRHLAAMEGEPAIIKPAPSELALEKKQLTMR